MTLVKICGLTTGDAVEAAVTAGATHLGVVFYPPSPRALSAERAAALLAARRGTKAVGLFVAPAEAEVEAVLRAVRLDVLQVNADARRAAAVRARFGLPVWRAVHVSGPADLPDDAEGADALLLDAAPPPGAALPGGNAVPFDWSALAGWRPRFPWVLAGGLTPDNVGEAIRTTGAPGVDVSSGVERVRGVKDPDLIRAFVAAARAA
jgi:phosphoribosylanthranilate isomerase